MEKEDTGQPAGMMYERDGKCCWKEGIEGKNAGYTRRMIIKILYFRNTDMISQVK